MKSIKIDLTYLIGLVFALAIILPLVFSLVYAIATGQANVNYLN